MSPVFPGLRILSIAVAVPLRQENAAHTARKTLMDFQRVILTYEHKKASHSRNRQEQPPGIDGKETADSPTHSTEQEQKWYCQRSQPQWSELQVLFHGQICKQHTR